MHRKIIYIGTVIVLIGFAFIMINAIIQGPSDDGEPDLDLKTFSIETVTDEQIIGISSNYRSYLASQKYSGTDTDISNARYEDCDKTKCTLSAKKINGIQTVSATRAQDCVLTLDIESSLDAGEMKIAVVMDGEILEYVPVGGSAHFVYNVTGEHYYYVKIIAENAEMSISVNRNIA